MNIIEKALRGLDTCCPVTDEHDERGCDGCPYDPYECERRPTVPIVDTMIEDLRAALREGLHQEKKARESEARLERIAEALADYAWPPETDVEEGVKMDHVRRRGQWIKFLRSC